VRGISLAFERCRYFFVTARRRFKTRGLRVHLCLNKDLDGLLKKDLRGDLLLKTRIVGLAGQACDGVCSARTRRLKGTKRTVTKQ
jgi:hypothetical protein